MALTHKLIFTLIVCLAMAACGGDEDDEGGSTYIDLDASKTHQVLAFNDLGMHCADLDYSVFTILPPYNMVNAQVIEKGPLPRILDGQEVEVSYHAVVDASGSINTSSEHKTNFWDYVERLFGINLDPDLGLAGQAMPGVANDPQFFNEYVAQNRWFTAAGIPILPIDDAGNTNPYPLMRISAVDPNDGNAMVSLDVVLPIASETDCQNCHVTAQDRNDFPDPAELLNAAKRNILALHDAQEDTHLASSTPVLCSTCHYSEPLASTYTGGSTKSMSNVMHEHHGKVAAFASDSMEDTCYQCHPGNTTHCLRGAMGSAGIECRDCHGGMLAVGNPDREPWLDEPKCQSCHTGDAVSNLTGVSGTLVNQTDSDNNIDGIRLRQAWLAGDDSAMPIVATNKRFAEDPADAGVLYKNGAGHGGVACEACHGSTHAIWPSSKENDNKASITLQRHTGTIIECGVCHTSLEPTLSGPHGMHNVNSSAWTLGHGGFYARASSACKACHGRNLEGTVLSRTAADRQYYRDDDGGRISVAKGTPVGCTLCHGYPGNDD